MPDGVTIVEGRHLMAANWDRGHPWHRLGFRATKDMSIEEALELSGSDDFVYPVTLYDIENLNALGRGSQSDSEEEAEAPDIIGIKSDKYGIMGYGKPSYEITQRKEILELAYDITGLAKGDAHVDTIGNLGDRAQKFFAYIRVPDLVIDPQGVADTIERGVFVATSFDRTLPNVIGESSIRPVCANTLKLALGSASNLITALHTRNSEARMRQAAEALEYVGAVDKAMTARAEEMLRIDGDKALVTVLNDLWPITEGMSQTARSRRERERADVHMLYDGPDNLAVDKLGRNGLAAYNAVVEFIDHGRTVKGKRASLVRSEQNVLPGETVKRKVKASKLVLASA